VHTSNQSAAAGSSSVAVAEVPVERTILSHFAAVPKKIPVVEKPPQSPEKSVPNQSIIPENESEEDRVKRSLIEKMFDDEGNENESPRENVDLRSDPKGKGLMYPSESFKNNESNQNA
jgi:hypothetical protein